MLRVRLALLVLSFQLAPSHASATDAVDEHATLGSRIELSAKRARPRWIDASHATLAAPMQDLHADVSTRGLRVRSVDEGGDAFVDVTVVAFGRNGAMQAPLSGIVTIDGNVIRARRGRLVEEITSDTDGIRQDFLLDERPAGMGKLALELQFARADLEALDAAGTSAVAAVLTDGRRLLYQHLRVTDAAGQTLSASMHRIKRDRLRIEVDDGAASYPIRIDPTFTDADWTALDLPAFDGTVMALATTAGGDLYVGGEFSVINDVVANRIARWNGSTWSALGSGLSNQTPPGARVKALAWDEAGGQLYVGGQFAGGGIARWNGTGWSALGSGASNVNALHWDAGAGRLYAGGSFTSISGVSANGIASWDGSSWSALGSGVGSVVNAIARDAGGNRLFVGGSFTTAGGNSANRIAQWNGSAWSALGLGMSGTVNALAWDPTAGALHAGGLFSTAGGTSASNVARWNGATWTALGVGTDGSVRALQWDGGAGRLIAGGDFGSAGGATVNRIAQWNGSTWAGFGTGVNLPVHAIALESGSGAFYAGGEFRVANGITNASRLARWTGSTWTALPGGTHGSVKALVWDADGGRLFVGGAFTNMGNVANNIALWNGSGWSALGAGIGGAVHALAFDRAGGRLFAGGSFLTAGGSAANRIAQWNGAAWTALGAGMDGPVNALAWDSTISRLFAGGTFTTAGSVSASNVARWSGGAWADLGAGTNSTVHALLWDSNLGLFVGGDFTAAGGSGANFIANWTGAGWTTLGTGLNNSVFSLAFDAPNFRVFAGGNFTTAGGASANRVAQWSGSAWTSVVGGLNDTVRALVYDPESERLFAGGDFRTGGSFGGERVAVWDPKTFFEWGGIGSGTNATVSALAFDPRGGRLFVGGAFTIAGAKPAAGIARNSVGIPQAELVVAASPTTIPFGGTTSLSSSGGSGTGAVDYQVMFSGGAFCSIQFGTGTLTGVGVGNCFVRARKLADATYMSTASQPIEVTVTKADQAAVSVQASPASIAFQSTSTLTSTGGSGTGVVTYAVSSGSSFCALDGNVLTGTGVGSCSVLATKAGDANYNPSTASTSVTVTKAAQAALTAVATPARIVRNGTAGVSASGGSGGGALSYALTAGESACSLANDAVTGLALGSCVVTATKAGDANFDPASASVEITVSRLDQATLTATSTPPSVPLGGTSSLATSGGSGLGAVSFAVTVGASSCTSSGSTLTGVGVGSCTVSATKDGDADYEPTTATVAIEVVRASQATLVAIASPATVALDGTSALSTSGGSGGGAVSYAVTAGAASCGVAGTTLTGTTSGDCTVTATKAGDASYEAAAAAVNVSVRRTADLQIAKDAGVDQRPPGSALVYAITATNAGPNAVTGALLIDDPPAGLADVTWACVPAASTATCPPPPYDAGTGLLAVVLDLPAGTNLRYDLGATLTAAAGTVVSNTANLSPPAGTVDPVASNQATDVVLVAGDAIFASGFE